MKAPFHHLCIPRQKITLAFVLVSMTLIWPTHGQQFREQRVGASIVGKLDAHSLQIGSPILREQYGPCTRKGALWRVRLEEGQAASIQLTSNHFDAYLVVRDELGKVLAEDDNGLYGSNAVVNLRATDSVRVLAVAVCSLWGEGSYVLDILEGPRPSYRPEERVDLALTRAEAAFADASHSGEATTHLLLQLGQALAANGRSQEAGQRLLQAAEMARAARDDEPMYEGWVLSRLTNYRLAQRQYDQAIDLSKQVLEIFERSLGPDHRWVADAYVLLGKSQRQRNKESARQTFTRAHELRYKLLGENHHGTISTLWLLAEVVHELGDVPRALTLHQQALAAARSRFGEDSAWVGQAHMYLGPLCALQGQVEQSHRHTRAAFDTLSRHLDPVDRRVFTSCLGLGETLNLTGRAEEALRHLQEAVERYEGLLGPDHPWLGKLYLDEGRFLGGAGRFTEAQSALELAYRSYHNALGARDHNTGHAQSLLAEVQYALGNYDRALEICRRCLESLGIGQESIQSRVRCRVMLSHILCRTPADPLARWTVDHTLALVEESLGEDHPIIAELLLDLIVLCDHEGNLDQAEAAWSRALRIRDQAALQFQDDAEALSTWAKSLRYEGRQAQAIVVQDRLVRLRREEYGLLDPRTARSQLALATLLSQEGGAEDAADLGEEAVAALEETLGTTHGQTLDSLAELAFIYRNLGELQSAIEIGEALVVSQERTAHRSSEKKAQTLLDLAQFYCLTGRLEEAPRRIESAVEMLERSVGRANEVTLRARVQLGLVHCWMENYEEGGGELVRCLAQVTNLLGEDSALAGSTRGLLGEMYLSRGDFPSAKEQLERALPIALVHRGPRDTQTLHYRIGLAAALIKTGEFKRAREAIDTVLAATEMGTSLEYQSLHVSALRVFGYLRYIQADYEDASAILQKALTREEQTLGIQRPRRAHNLSNLAKTEANLGNLARARELAMEALQSAWRNLERYHGVLTEAEKVHAKEKARYPLHLLLSLSVNERKEQRLQEVYEALLRTKGWVTRTSRWSNAPEAQDHEELLVLSRLQAVHARISARFHSMERTNARESERSLQNLRRQQVQLERKLEALRGAESLQEPILDELADALPPDSATLDFYIHRHFEPAVRSDEELLRPAESGPERVTCWIVRAGEASPIRIDLGLASELRHATQAYLQDIVSRRGVRHLSEDDVPQLFDRLWKPLQSHLEGVQLLLVSPDQFLFELPFETLPGSSGRFLLEDHSIVYLEELASVTELGRRDTPSSGLLAVGDVDFSNASLAAKYWPPLGQTRHEVESVLALHESHFDEEGGRSLLSGMDASEEAIVELAPQRAFLHFATHGYFEPVSGHLDPRGQALSTLDSGFLTLNQQLPRLEPRLLSGLVCSGGTIWTASEVRWLDLRGCQLVTLSACETGLGMAWGGEGMASLRQAFRQAGARCVISSLWSVKDDSTTELMVSFYQYLWRHQKSPSQALRRARLEMLKSNRSRFGDPLPSTWGAFVLSGDFRLLTSNR
jgi:CHAT domain-containing protein